MKTQFLLGGDTLEAKVIAGDLVFEGTDHMITVFTKLRDKRLHKVKLYFAAGLELRFDRSDGWEIKIKEEAGNDQDLVITRSHVGDRNKKLRQYLGTNMKWLSIPKGASELTADAFRLPLFGGFENYL